MAWLPPPSPAINNNNNKLQTFCPHRLGLADERDTVLVSTGLFEGLCICDPTSVAPIPELSGSNMYYVRGRHGRAYDTDFPVVCDMSLYDTTAPQGCAAEMKGYTIFMNKNAIHLHVRPCNKLQIHRLEMRTEAHAERAHARPSPYSFVVASGAMRLLMILMIHRGNALTATMTATFHPNRAETTNERSGRQKRKGASKDRKREGAGAGKECGTGTHRNIRGGRPC